MKWWKWFSLIPEVDYTAERESDRQFWRRVHEDQVRAEAAIRDQFRRNEKYENDILRGGGTINEYFWG